MADEIFENPRLAAIYDELDPDRSDLEVYVALVEELGARTVLDIGCGTGTFAIMLVARGIDVAGVEPAGASLDVARSKPDADRVRWIHGVATTLPPLQVDVATMTANVAQVFVSDEAWIGTLQAIHSAIRPGGHLVFESRDPSQQAWLGWNRDDTYSETDIEGVGVVTTWVDLTAVQGDLVSFRWTNVFARDGAALTGDSTLRFRSRDQLEQSLRDAGFDVLEVRDAPDRPGRELVFIASREAVRSFRDRAPNSPSESVLNPG